MWVSAQTTAADPSVVAGSPGEGFSISSREEMVGSTWLDMARLRLWSLQSPRRKTESVILFAFSRKAVSAGRPEVAAGAAFGPFGANPPPPLEGKGGAPRTMS